MVLQHSIYRGMAFFSVPTYCCFSELLHLMPPSDVDLLLVHQILSTLVARWSPYWAYEQVQQALSLYHFPFAPPFLVVGKYRLTGFCVERVWFFDLPLDNGAEFVSCQLHHEVLEEFPSQVWSVASGLLCSSTHLALSVQRVVTSPLTFLSCSMWAIMLLP